MEDLVDLKRHLDKQMYDLNRERENQMIVDWVLEGKIAAYKDLKNMVNNFIAESHKEVLVLTQEEIDERGRMYATPRHSYDEKPYTREDVARAYSDGMLTVLNMLKN